MGPVIRLGFLGSRPFRCEGSAFEPWIRFQSLVRIETFEGVTRLVAGKIFLGSCSRGARPTGTGAAVEAVRKRRIVHGASLT